MTRALVRQLADLRRQLKGIRAAQVGYVQAPVTAVDQETGTFTVEVPSEQDDSTLELPGLTAPAHFLPSVGDMVLLAMAGAKPYYQPVRIADRAVGSEQLADGAVGETQLDPSVTLSINGKTSATFSVDPPDDTATPGAAEGDVWWQYDAGTAAIIGTWQWDGTTWQQRTFGDAVLSSLAVGKLIAGEIAAGQAVYFGPQNGTHAEGSSTGFRVFRVDPDNGTIDEVIRLGTSDDDFLAVVDSAGLVVASIDSTGQGNFTGLNVAGDPVIQGQSLAETLAALPTGLVAYGHLTTGASNIVSEFGLFETSAWKTTTGPRSWRVDVGIEFFPTSGSDGDMALFLHWTHGSAPPTPSLTSPVLIGGVSTGQISDTTISHKELSLIFRTDNMNGDQLADGENARLLLSVASPNTMPYEVRGTPRTFLRITDLGPAISENMIVTNGGGTNAPPVQDHDTGWLAPTGGRGAGYWSFRQNGTLRTDTNDVVQGLDPSGFNGDGNGAWKFAIPNISGTITRVDLSLRSNHTYFNSGGRAKLNLTDQPNLANPSLLHGVYTPPNVYPDPGTVAITLPSTWYASIKGKTSIGVTVGPGGSDETNYVRFDGAAARLRIWYNQ